MSPSDRPAGQLPAERWFLAEWPHVFLPGNRRICGHPVKRVGPLASRNRLVRVGLAPELPSPSWERSLRMATAVGAARLRTPQGPSQGP